MRRDAHRMSHHDADPPQIPTDAAHAPRRLPHWLFRPVPIAPLVYFRIALGLIIVWEAVRYVRNDWVHQLFLAGTFQFKYYGFGWVRPWPGDRLHDHFMLIAALGVMIAAGLFYRAAAALFFLAFTYTFLLDQANYLNHLYLLCLLGFLLPFLPAHRAISADVFFRPRLARTHVPAWTWVLLVFQLGVPYFFGGVAKITSDWLRGEPVRTWMRGDHYPVVGGWPATEGGVWVISYGGLLFDLLVVPALLWRRTRPPAVAAAVAFHLFNFLAFDIGIFPWLMLTTLPLFFSIKWWERINQRFVVPFSTRRDAHDDEPTTAAPAPSPPALDQSAWTTGRRVAAALLAAYVAVQVLVPLRHWLYPGTVHWTEQGHRFAWHMMLRTKAGSATFTVTHPNLPERVSVDQKDHLTPRQRRKMPVHPDMVLQFAHHLARQYERDGIPGVRVRADAHVSLNGRLRQPMIDPGVDLASVERSLLPASWVLPLREPLRIEPLPWRPPPREPGGQAEDRDRENNEPGE